MKAFILDVDGVMTDGKMYYTAEGKMMKAFGPDDHEALKMIEDKIHIEFVTGDFRGFPISKRRIEDMGFKVTLIEGVPNRLTWVENNWGLMETIYMGDSLWDALVFSKFGYSICPADAFYTARRAADYVTHHTGGDRAVAEACMHIKEKFLV